MVLLLPAWLVGCDPFHANFQDVEPAVLYEANVLSPVPDPGGALKVMTYNIRFGGARIEFFQDCWGDRTLMEEREVYENVEGIVQALKIADPDILFLQEVDVNSKQSAYIDQLQLLLDRTSLNYGAYASNWKADYVPSDGFGPIDMGGAILSRWPLRNATRVALPLFKTQDPLIRYFYLKRNMLRASVDIPGAGTIHLLNAHLANFGDLETKLEQIDLFQAEMSRLASLGTVIGGGDLNTLPPGTQICSGFDDQPCTRVDLPIVDYCPFSSALAGLYASFNPAVALSDYQADSAAYFTFTADANDFWNRKLDYLFTNGMWEPGSAITHQDSSTGLATMPLSDHCPVAATLRLP